MYTAEASVNVSANPQTTWSFVSNYQNFDRFMSNVKEIKMLEGNLSEWHLAGPLGIDVSWKATTTEHTPPNRLAWHSTEGSLENTGFIAIAPNGTGSIVTVHVEYTPPLGAIGEAVATIFKDPQAMLEHDLAQLENLISGGDTDDLKKISEMDGLVQDENITALPNLNALGGMAGYAVTARAGEAELEPRVSELEKKLR